MALNLLKAPLNTLYKLVEKGSVDTPLIVLGAFGWFVSMLAQITAIKTNSNISDEKKKFLLPQETADGLVNTGLYLGVTTLFSNTIKKAISKGKIIIPGIEREIQEVIDQRGLKETVANVIKKANNATKKEDYLDEFFKGKEDDVANLDEMDIVPNRERAERPGSSLDKRNISSIDRLEDVAEDVIGRDRNDTFEQAARGIKNEVITEVETEARNLGREAESNLGTFKTFKSGAGVIATIAGSVLSCNIITPILRNEIGAHFQQKAEMAQKPKATAAQFNMLTPNAYTNSRAIATFSSITKI